MARRREGGLGPALIASLAVHAGVVALLFVSVPKQTLELAGNAIPVTIVSSLPQAAPAPAPEVAEPAAEDAAPETAEPEPAPEPEPTPPPPPQPKLPTKKAEPPPPQKTPAPKTPPRKTPPSKQAEEPALDLAALQKSLNRGRPATKATSTRVTPSTGAAQQGQLSAAGASALSALVGRIQDSWILNCEIPGASEVEVTVAFTIGSSGRLSAGPTLVGRRAGAVWSAASTGALAAVRSGEPYEGLPRDLYNQPIEATFKAGEACAGR
jgi:outer membrane biosynthesis protein TonB